MNGDTGRVDLRHTGVGEVGALLVALPCGRTVRGHGVRRKEEDVGVTARGDHYGVGSVTLDGAGDEVADDDAACTAVDDNEVEHFVARKHLHFAFAHLTAEGRIGAQQKLLTRLAAGVEGSRYLRTTEGAVVEQAAVFAGEGYALCYALVDDGVRDFSQTIDVGFASTIVTTLDGVVEEAIDGVAVVLIVLGCVDTTLCGDGVCAARGVLNTEVEYVEAHLGERSCG